MSRIGRRLIKIPEDVKFQVDSDFMNVQIIGPLGTLKKKLSGLISVTVNKNLIKTECLVINKNSLQMVGTTNSLLENWIHGVVSGYQKKLIIKGLGFKAQLSDRILELNLGFSHPIYYPIPSSISIEVFKKTELTIKGIDKALVGLVASQIRKKKKPEPYKGKGIMYQGEKIKRKVGKTVASKK